MAGGGFETNGLGDFVSWEVVGAEAVAGSAEPFCSLLEAARDVVSFELDFGSETVAFVLVSGVVRVGALVSWLLAAVG